MAEGHLFWRGAGPKKLRQLLPDAGLPVSGPAGGHVTAAEGAHAGQIMFQLQEGRACPVAGAGAAGETRLRALQAGRAVVAKGRAPNAADGGRVGDALPEG